MSCFGRWRKVLLFYCILAVSVGITTTIFAKSLEDEYQSQKQHQEQNSPSTTGKIANQPQRLYFEALELEKKGEFALALVKLSEAYGEENILVDSYYEMLDRKRMHILQDIENGAPWSPGAPDKTKMVQSTRKQFRALRSRLDCSIYHIAPEYALPFERFLNYRIVQETGKKTPAQYLDGPDPWMLSTVLFLAAKGDLKIQPESVIKRWERRPDLWDDICTEQALLYLETLRPDTLKTLNISNEDIKMAVQPLVKTVQKSLLLDCASHFNPSGPLLTVDMSVKEKIAYESLKRVEISIRNTHGKELFRAMNNRSSKCAPIPPNAFGIYPVGKNKKLSLRDVKSAGMEAGIPVKTKYGNLVERCRTSWSNSTLNIHWQIQPVGWKFPDGRGDVFVKIVPADKKDATWISCGSFTYPGYSSKSDKAMDKHSELANITPQFYYRHNRQKVREGTFSTVTLVKLKQVPAKAIIIRWKGDIPNKYDYVEVSRKMIDLRKHKSISLEPGFYQFEYNDVRGDPPAGFYGKSDLFEVKDGVDMEIPMWVESAI